MANKNLDKIEKIKGMLSDLEPEKYVNKEKIKERADAERKLIQDKLDKLNKHE